METMETEAMCRLCLRQESDTVPLTTEDCELREVIDKVFYFRINRSTDSPTFICEMCRKRVNDFYQYAEEVLKNQDALDSMFVLSMITIGRNSPSAYSEIKEDCTNESHETDWIGVETGSDTVAQDDVSVEENIEIKRDPELQLDCAEVDEETVLPEEIEQVETKQQNGVKRSQRLLQRKIVRPKGVLADVALDKFVLKHHKLTCDLCSVPLKNFIEMRQHFTSVHNEEPYMKCCDKKFYKKYRMVQHIQLHIDPKAFRCEYCKKNYSSKKVLREHIKEICGPKANQDPEVSTNDSVVVAQEPESAEPSPDELVLQHYKLSCDLCSQPIKDFKVLRNHFLSVHNEPPYLNCCGKKLYKRFKMVQHLQLHVDPEAFRCELCNRNYASKRVLREHQKEFHEPHKSPKDKIRRTIKPRQEGLPPNEDELVLQHFQLSCDLCEAQIPDFRKLREHYETIHNEEPYIICCDKKLYKKYRMVQHLQLHLDPNAFQCSVCHKNYNSKKILREHEKEIHYTAKEPKQVKTPTVPPQCETCKKEFASRSLLRAHQRKIHSMINCPQCSKQLVAGSLWKHLLSIHGNSTQYICEICARSFRDKRCFQAHMKGHMGTRHEDRVQCTICSIWLTNKYQLTKHVKRIHIVPDKDEKHQCNVCGKQLRSRELLNHHKHRFHSRLRFECDVCHQKFRMLRLMKEHVALQHTREYLYKCKYCGEEFFTQNKHYTHRKNKHPVEFEADIRKRTSMNAEAAD